MCCNRSGEKSLCFEAVSFFWVLLFISSVPRKTSGSTATLNGIKHSLERD